MRCSTMPPLCPAGSGSGTTDVASDAVVQLSRSSCNLNMPVAVMGSVHDVHHWHCPGSCTTDANSSSFQECSAEPEPSAGQLALRHAGRAGVTRGGPPRLRSSSLRASERLGSTLPRPLRGSRVTENEEDRVARELEAACAYAHAAVNNPRVTGTWSSAGSVRCPRGGRPRGGRKTPLCSRLDWRGAQALPALSW